MTTFTKILAPLLAVMICTTGPASARDQRQPDGANARELAKAIAEISDVIEEGQRDGKKKILKTFITSNNKDPVYGVYYRTATARIEQIGSANFPEIDGKKQYGKLIIYVPIAESGELYLADGGPRVLQSSGNRWLDQYALQPVRNAAPYPAFHIQGLPNGSKEVRVLITEFKFTHLDIVGPKQAREPAP